MNEKKIEEKKSFDRFNPFTCKPKQAVYFENYYFTPLALHIRYVIHTCIIHISTSITQREFFKIFIG